MKIVKKLKILGLLWLMLSALVMLILCNWVAAEHIDLEKAGNGLLISGYGIDDTQYLECNDSCRISFTVTKPDPIVEVQQELYDCNYSDIEGVLLYLNNTIGSLANRTSNESGNGTVSLVYDDRSLRDWIKNDGDDRLSKIHEIIEESIQPLMITNVADNSKELLANKSVELAKAQADLDFQKQKVDTVVAENYTLNNSSNNMFWITLGSLLIAVVGASSPYAPSIARRLGMNESFKGLRR